MTLKVGDKVKITGSKSFWHGRSGTVASVDNNEHGNADISVRLVHDGIDDVEDRVVFTYSYYCEQTIDVEAAKDLFDWLSAK